MIEAKRRAYQTFFRTTYQLDAFLGKPVIPIQKYEGSNLESPAYTKFLNYKSDEFELGDFASWLEMLMKTARFRKTRDVYVALAMKLKDESNRQVRINLTDEMRKIENL